jgi:hypothetical protein
VHLDLIDVSVDPTSTDRAGNDPSRPRVSPTHDDLCLPLEHAMRPESKKMKQKQDGMAEGVSKQDTKDEGRG